MQIGDDGFHLVSSAFDEKFSNSLWHQANQVYERWGGQGRGDIVGATSERVPAPVRYVPQASSFTLESVYSEPLWRKLLERLSRGQVGERLRESLGDSVLCDLDQSWVRRQFAPHRYPSIHSPHGWHQDGALRFDFLSNDRRGESPGPDALLSMLTCWVAITPCGRSAPGLELIRHRVDGLIPFTELSDPAIRARFHEDLFWRPELRAGDALMFSGDVLHRTHVHESMTEDRTSLEFRFVAKGRVPERLAEDRLIALV